MPQCKLWQEPWSHFIVVANYASPYLLFTAIQRLKKIYEQYQSLHSKDHVKQQKNIWNILAKPQNNRQDSDAEFSHIPCD